MGLTLEVGSGHNPDPRADVLCDRYLKDDTERGGDLKTANRPIVVGDAENLPFLDDSFEYSIANHVVEHLGNPDRCLDELQRISKAGHIETPSEIMERLHSKPYHQWYVARNGDTLIFQKKKGTPESDLGKLVPELWERSAKFRELHFERKKIFEVELEWEGSIDYEFTEPDGGMSLDLEDSETIQELLSSNNSELWKTWIPKFMWVPLKILVARFRNFMSVDQVNLDGVLACPKCKSPIAKLEDEDCYKCDRCNMIYPVKNNIPILLTDESQKILS